MKKFFVALLALSLVACGKKSNSISSDWEKGKDVSVEKFLETVRNDNNIDSPHPDCVAIVKGKIPGQTISVTEQYSSEDNEDYWERVGVGDTSYALNYFTHLVEFTEDLEYYGLDSNSTNKFYVNPYAASREIKGKSLVRYAWNQYGEITYFYARIADEKYGTEEMQIQFNYSGERAIEVEPGRVDVQSEISIVSVSQLGDIPIEANADGKYITSTGGVTYFDAEQGALKLERWAPGDKAVISFVVKNNSNMKIQTRFVEERSSTSNPSLCDGLTIDYSINQGDSEEINEDNYREWTIVECPKESGQVLYSITITIELKDSDSQYMNTDCAFSFRQEAVQGNAKVD